MAYSTRPYQTPGGGPLNFFGPLPPVVMYLIAVNVVAFVITLFLRNFMVGFLALIPIAVVPGLQFWRLLTYLFLHADFSHLLFNMLTLWWFGAPLFQVWGRRRFLIYYFACGIGAGMVCVPFYYLVGESHAPILGASGALYALLMAFALIYPNSRVYLYFLVPIKVKWLIVFFIIMEFAATASTLTGGHSAVASIAHLSGMVIGYFIIRRDMDLRALYRRFQTRKLQRPYRVMPDHDDRPQWLH